MEIKTTIEGYKRVKPTGYGFEASNKEEAIQKTADIINTKKELPIYGFESNIITLYCISINEVTTYCKDRERAILQAKEKIVRDPEAYINVEIEQKPPRVIR